MKLTKSKLKQLIKEELQKVLKEASPKSENQYKAALNAFRTKKDRPAFNAMRKIYGRGGAGWANLFAMCYTNGGLKEKTTTGGGVDPIKCDAKNTPACLEACASKVWAMLLK